MQKELKFQSEVTCKVDDTLYTFKSNELVISVQNRQVQRTSIPYVAMKEEKRQCNSNNKIVFGIILAMLCKR